MTNEDKWHIDRTINLPMLIAFLGYIVFATWYASKADSRIETNVQHTQEVEAKVIALALEAKGERDRTSNDIGELKGKVTEIGTKVDILLSQRFSDLGTKKK